MDADVIVVGAGPAGGMAAWHLAPYCRVIVVERARLPRVKLCSGVLTRKAAAALDPVLDITGSLIGRCDGVRVSRGSAGAAAELAVPLLFASRASLDLALADAAARRGADVREGMAVTAVDPDSGTVSLARGTLRARALIGADGGTGVTARAVAERLPAAGVALETVLPDPRRGRRPALLDTALRGGYFWAFPKADGSVAVGGGSMRADQGPGLRGRIARWALAALDLRLPMRVRGAPVPWRRPARLVRGRTLLAGDAAGLVDPLLGEGIPYALWSGRAAALHTLRCLDGAAAWEAYPRALWPLRRWMLPIRALAEAGDAVRAAMTAPAVLRWGWPRLVDRVPGSGTRTPWAGCAGVVEGGGAYRTPPE